MILEADYARMESQMYAAKSDAFELQNKLDEVLGEVGRAGPRCPLAAAGAGGPAPVHPQLGRRAKQSSALSSK